MQARELIELAALVSSHGPVLLESGERISADGIEQYWTTSKVRLDRWGRSLKEFVRLANEGKTPHQPLVLGILEEILASEILTRVWTALLCVYDRQRGTDEAEPIARSVMLGHTEARHRVLTILVRRLGVDRENGLKLNRLRRRCEHWSDLLVGNIAGLHNVAEFAVSPERAKDFYEDMQRQNKPFIWALTMASLRAAFPQNLGMASPNTDLNARIASSILGCFPAELFDSTGLFHSLWLTRVLGIAEDTQCMIDDLLSSERPHRPNVGQFPSKTDRKRFG